MPAIAIPAPAKPRLRGIPHAIGAIIAIPAAALCVYSASSDVAGRAALVYGLSLVFLLGTSAIYHTLHWAPPMRMWLRRIDHLAIFVLIAGSYTPMCLLVLPEEEGRTLLLLAWSCAGAGALVSLFWPMVPRWINVGLSIGMGWLILPYGTDILAELDWLSISLWVVGGVLYSIGGITYARKSPDPIPLVFGYHEVFHCLVLAAVVCHYLAIWRMVV